MLTDKTNIFKQPNSIDAMRLYIYKNKITQEIIDPIQNLYWFTLLNINLKLMFHIVSKYFMRKHTSIVKQKNISYIENTVITREKDNA